MKRTSLILSCLFVAVAACGGGKKSVDKPVPDPKPTGSALACDVEIALACDTESHDGCGDGRTAFHACVPDGETAGPACELEIAKVCPDGQIDACMATPQLASTHLCVYDPNAKQATSPSCPAGKSWYAPGCDGNPIPDEGCYAGCGDGAACGDGLACMKVSTDPCHNQACDACGMQQELCVPNG